MVEPTNELTKIALRSALLDHRIQQTRQELLEDQCTTIEQPVELVSLRNAFSRLEVVEEWISLNDGDTIEMVAQHPRGEQSRQTAAKDDSVPMRCRFDPST
jgi:hypothetical protein